MAYHPGNRMPYSMNRHQQPHMGGGGPRGTRPSQPQQAQLPMMQPGMMGAMQPQFQQFAPQYPPQQIQFQPPAYQPQQLRNFYQVQQGVQGGAQAQPNLQAPTAVMFQQGTAAAYNAQAAQLAAGPPPAQAQAAPPQPQAAPMSRPQFYMPQQPQPAPPQLNQTLQQPQMSQMAAAQQPGPQMMESPGGLQQQQQAQQQAQAQAQKNRPKNPLVFLDPITGEPVDLKAKPGEKASGSGSNRSPPGGASGGEGGVPEVRDTEAIKRNFMAEVTRRAANGAQQTPPPAGGAGASSHPTGAPFHPAAQAGQASVRPPMPPQPVLQQAPPQAQQQQESTPEVPETPKTPEETPAPEPKVTTPEPAQAAPEEAPKATPEPTPAASSSEPAQASAEPAAEDKGNAAEPTPPQEGAGASSPPMSAPSHPPPQAAPAAQPSARSPQPVVQQAPPPQAQQQQKQEPAVEVPETVKAPVETPAPEPKATPEPAQPAPEPPKATPEPTPATSSPEPAQASAEPAAEAAAAAAAAAAAGGADEVEEAAAEQEQGEEDLEEGEIRDEEEEEEESDPNIQQARAVADLNLEYKSDQWSPNNPDGQKRYDRDFLMQFRGICNLKPTGLPNFPDINRPVVQTGGAFAGGHGGNLSFREMSDFTGMQPPGWDKTFFTNAQGGGQRRGPPARRSSQGPQGPQGSQGSRRGQGAGPSGSMQKVIIRERVDIKPTHTAGENAWKPSMMDSGAAKPTVDGEEGVKRKCRMLLNKLTPENFQRLLNQMFDLIREIDTVKKLKAVIDIIHAKAITESKYVEAYSQLCHHVSLARLQDDVEATEAEQPAQRSTKKTNTFRKYILYKCQTEFERELYTDIDVEGRKKALEEEKDLDRKLELKEDMDLEMSLDRKKQIGNMKFVGELFKLEMLTESIMHSIIKKLFMNKSDESLEMLCVLLTTCGQNLDTEQAANRIDQYFTRLRELHEKKTMSSKVSFGILEILELRDAGWVEARRTDKAKTISELRQQVVLDEQREKVEIERRRQESRNNPRGRGGYGGGGGHDDGFTVVAPKPKYDASKMKLSKPVTGGDIRLGPGAGFSSWGNRGSGKQIPSRDSDSRPSTPRGNRFSMLGEGGGGSGGGNSSADERPPSGRSTPVRQDSRERPRHGGRSSDGRMGPPQGRAPRAIPSRGSGSRDARDRQGALKAVRQISGGGSGPDSRNNSRPSSREASRSREEARAPSPADMNAPPPPKQLSEDPAKRREDLNTITAEYLHSHVESEAIFCIKALSPEGQEEFITLAIELAMERPQKQREMVGKLHADLLQQRVISAALYKKGMENFLEVAPDFEPDFPKIYEYLGEVFCPVLLNSGVITLKDLGPGLESLKGAYNGKPSHLLAGILQAVSGHVGHIKTVEMWAQSGLTWTQFFETPDEIAAFLEKKDLKWVVSSEQSPRRTIDLDSAGELLNDLISVKASSNETVFDWVEENMGSHVTHPRFIHALARAAFTDSLSAGATNSHMKFDDDKLRNRCTLVQRYVDRQATLEMQVLYAVQHVVHDLEHPSGLLSSFFEFIYEEELVSEEAFYAWRDDKNVNPAFAESRGIALQSVKSFFDWLAMADNEQQQPTS